MRTFRLARSLSPAVQVLLVNSFGIAFGFFVLVPFLATYLRDERHLTAAAVGAILGLRVFCQQGLTLVGGTAADRFGARPVIIIGCALRCVAFGMFAVVDQVVGLVVASMLVGLAGAFFSPAARAYIAVEAGERRLDAFALQNIATTVGALTGPLLGSVLVAVDFRWTAAVSAAIFAVLTVWQCFALPYRKVEPVAARALGLAVRDAVHNRSFLGFAVATSVLFLLYNQFYLSLPLEATRVTGWAGAAGCVFLVSTLVTLGTQLRMIRWLRRRLAPGVAIVCGLVAIAASFVPLVWSTTSEPADSSGGLSTELAVGILVAAVPVLVTTLLLTLGLDVAQPYALDLVSGFAPVGFTGTYIGLATTAAGITTALGNTAIGYADDLGRQWSTPWISPVMLGTLAVGAAVAVAVLQRGGRLSLDPPTST
jgi:MFS family permease